MSGRVFDFDTLPARQEEMRSRQLGKRRTRILDIEEQREIWNLYYHRRLSFKWIAQHKGLHEVQVLEVLGFPQ